jgi:hypothetical protein
MSLAGRSQSVATVVDVARHVTELTGISADEVDVTACAEDEQVRYAVYRKAVARLAPADDAPTLALLRKDPDVDLVESVFLSRIAGVAAVLPPSDLAAWLVQRRDLLGVTAALRVRVDEWLVLARVLAGDRVPEGACAVAGDWLQRRLAREAVSDDVLVELAAHGRSDAVRAEARDRLAALARP